MNAVRTEERGRINVGTAFMLSGMRQVVKLGQDDCCPYRIEEIEVYGGKG